MANDLNLQTDAQGNIITKPVIGWTTGILAKISVLLAIQYIETPAEFETGGKTLQFVLMPQQCLELAEKLTTLAQHVLQDDSGTPPQ